MLSSSTEMSVCACLCVPLTQQILCSILVVVCVVWEMVDLGTHTSLQACEKTEWEGGRGRGGVGEGKR